MASFATKFDKSKISRLILSLMDGFVITLQLLSKKEGKKNSIGKEKYDPG